MKTALLLIAFVGSALCDVNEKARLSNRRVSSDFFGLLAPQATNNRDVQSTDPCKDPFHSFLCAPLKPRVSVGGKLRSATSPDPETNKADQQPIESGSALLSRQLEYLPSSNAQPSRQYLPVTANQAQLITDPVQPLQNHKFAATSLLPNNAYLPVQPLSTNENPVIFTSGPSRNYLPLDEPNVSAESTNLSPNIGGKALLSDSSGKDRSKNEESHTLERLCNDPFHSFLCKPLKPRRRIDGRLRPEAKLPPNVLVAASSIAREARVLPQAGGSVLSSSLNQPSRNYLPFDSKNPISSPNENRFNSYTTKRPETPSKPTTFVYSRPVNSFNYNLQGNTLHPQSFSSPTIQSITNPPKTNFPTEAPENQQYQSPSNSQVYLAKPNEQKGYNFGRPSPPYIYSTTQSPSTIRPTHFQTSTIRPSVNQTLQIPVNGYAYQRPSIVQQNSRPDFQSGYNFQTHFTTKYPPTFPSSTYSSTNKPILKPSFGYNYENPTNIQLSFSRPLVGNGFANDNPSSQSTFGNSGSPTINFSSTIFQTSTYRPSNSQLMPNIGTGNIFAKPTEIKQNYVSPINQNGYHYEKPLSPFTYGTTKRPSTPFQTTYQTTTVKPISTIQSFLQTTLKPFAGYPSPSNFQQSFLKPQNGYVYQKPVNSIALISSTTYRPPTFVTSTYKPVSVQSSTNRPITYPSTIKPVQDYYYQNPTNIQQNIVHSGSQAGYDYERPSSQFTTSKPTTTYRPPTITSTYRPVSFQTTTSKPITYSTSNKPFQNYEYNKPTNIQENYVRPGGQNGYSYDKPASQFTYGTSTKPSTTYRPSTFITSTYKPVNYYTISNRPITVPSTIKPVQNNNYPNPSNIQTTFIQPGNQNGYNYEKPSTQFTYETTSKPELTNKPTTIASSIYRPAIYQTNSKPLHTYGSTTNPTTSYNPPSTFITSTARPTTTFGNPSTNKISQNYEYPKPTNVQQVFVKPSSQMGYNYEKPALLFTYGTTVKPSTFQTSTQRPNAYTTTYRPTYQTISSYTSTPIPTFFQTTKTPLGNNEYANPSNIQQNYVRPTVNKGYNYPVPSVPFTYGTTAKPTSYQTTLTPSTTVKPFINQPLRPQQDYSPNPTNIQQSFERPKEQNGYNYLRPSKPFPLPTNSPPTLNPKPSNNQPNIIKPDSEGYHYNVPTKLFNFSENKAQLNPLYIPNVTERSSGPNLVNGSNNEQTQDDHVVSLVKNNVLEQYNFRFGDRLQSKSPNDSGNNSSHNEEFLPLRNFEII